MGLATTAALDGRALGGGRPIRLLTFSTLYPSAARPIHGIFVETRLRELLSSGLVESKVVAPVPWFPWRHSVFGEYARQASVPTQENRYCIEILHPRYPHIPKVGMTAAPFLLAKAIAPVVARLRRSYDFDAIDAHFFYPDGVAAAMLGERFGRPVVITARGSDVTLFPRYRLPRTMIRWAARKAAAVITVSRALKDDLSCLGVPPGHITVLRNGVDLQRFRPEDREAARAKLGLHCPTLLCVGHLIPRKAHDLVISALAHLANLELIIVGNGPEQKRLRMLARSVGVDSRVRFVPALLQPELPMYYSAATALVLASTREGWANVLLEAMACGTPVVASDVGGAAELVTTSDAGVLFRERTPEALATAIRTLLNAYPDRAATRRHAEKFSWAATTRGQIDLFNGVIAENRQVSKPLRQMMHDLRPEEAGAPERDSRP